MSKIVIYTQIRENYGDVENPYWKFKGGSEYVIEDCGIFQDDEFAFKKAQMIIDSIRDKIECCDDFCEEYVINHDVVGDDFLTDFERSQLDYDGQILFPAKVLEVV